MAEAPRATRRDFLRGWLSFGEGAPTGHSGRSGAVCRPPGAQPEVRLLELCTGPADGCRACVDACPEHCIIPAQPDVASHPQTGTPFLLPDESACTLCGLCQPACPTSALLPIAPEAARIGDAVIELSTCQSGRADGCRACVDACPYPDVAITLSASGDPCIILEACTGCGLCAVVCPTRAISIRPPQGQ